MQLEITPTTRQTRHHFASILDEANAWQKALGSEGWNSPFDDGWMLPRIERGELFLALADGQPVAAFRLLYEDRPFWGEREVGDSIYLHTFAVRRDRAGQGIGSAVIDRVADMARQRGLAKLRLDCFLANTNLISFYQRNGFTPVGTVTVSGRMMGLMERAILPQPHR